MNLLHKCLYCHILRFAYVTHFTSVIILQPSSLICVAVAAYKIYFKKNKLMIHITPVKKIGEWDADGETAAILLETDGYFVCLLLLAILRQ
jgi:hypothetical protein